MTTTASTSREFTPSEWLIDREFRHSDGVTYSPGEPVPVMTGEQAEALAAAGAIVRVDAPPQKVDRKITVEFLLAGNDLQVLRKLRQHQVGKRMLKQVFSRAVEMQRSHVLMEALRLLLGVPVEPEAEE